MTAATLAGCSSIARWQVGNTVPVACNLFTSSLSIAGGSIRSLLETTTHEGLVFQAATVNFSRLKGLRISAGFLSQVRKLLGGTEGCTHLVELMGPIATTAFQSIFPYRERLRQAAGKPSSDPQKKPLLLDTCHGFASDGEVVKQLWPKFYTGS